MQIMKQLICFFTEDVVWVEPCGLGRKLGAVLASAGAENLEWGRHHIRRGAIMGCRVEGEFQKDKL